MKLIKSFFQNVSSRFLAVVTLLWLSVENAFATGGGNGINASKIPDFKIPGVDSNTKDPMEIIFLVAKGLATLAAVLFAAWAILTVVKALIKTYNAATDENDKKGWGPFVIALILGFILIFFSLWLVKMAIGLF
ncbi:MULTISPECIES: DUF2976 domain-containing protein [Haemophilus]|jgi:conserved putative membrane protein|uniref:DUF2976 domain-containing protein n=1 Tax=Haemophilus TaxID=724 RepID=UPI000E28718F|nr:MULTISPECIES: DUF2976 domain-containing protein [Haemophilus]